MSFLAQLDDELRQRGVGPRVRRRIWLEYADHVACEPGCEGRLGEPAELARRFAGELAAAGARRAARDTFLALSLAAIALLLGQLTLAGVGSPGFDSGTSTWLSLPAIAVIVLAPQVALVAGSLAALRAVRRRAARELPDAEVALIHHRCRVAGVAGLLTCAGLLVYALNFIARLPAWWLALQLGLASAALVALAAALGKARAAARTVGGVPGSAVGLAGDLPTLAGVIGRPWRAWALVSLGAFALTTAFTGHAERSLAEGLQRGGFEGLALAAALGVAIAASRRRATGPSSPGPSSPPLR